MQDITQLWGMCIITAQCALYKDVLPYLAHLRIITTLWDHDDGGKTAEYAKIIG